MKNTILRIALILSVALWANVGAAPIVASYPNVHVVERDVIQRRDGPDFAIGQKREILEKRGKPGPEETMTIEGMNRYVYYIGSAENKDSAMNVLKKIMKFVTTATGIDHQQLERQNVSWLQVEWHRSTSLIASKKYHITIKTSGENNFKLDYTHHTIEVYLNKEKTQASIVSDSGVGKYEKVISM